MLYLWQKQKDFTLLKKVIFSFEETLILQYKPDLSNNKRTDYHFTVDQYNVIFKAS